MIIPGHRLACYRGIVTPILPRFREHGVSAGLGPGGYDVRIKDTTWMFPLIGRLAVTIEHFQMPDDVMGFVHDKSTWARRMVAVQNTVLEPGWRGYLTLELTLHRLWPVRIPAGAGIAQVIFQHMAEPAPRPYGRDDKYQDQPQRPVRALAS